MLFSFDAQKLLHWGTEVLFFCFFFKFLLNEKESLRFLYDERYDRVKVEYSSIRSYPPQKNKS